MSARRSFLAFAGLVLLGAALVVMLARAAPAEPREPFNSKLKKRLEAAQPEIVLIGNSMVNSRFTEAELGRLLAPKRVGMVAVGGSKSAFWYLALKNVVLPGTRPREILFFYRRRELTDARDRALGPDAHRLHWVSRSDDPFVAEILAPGWDEPVERIGWTLGRLAPVGRLHAVLEPTIDSFASSTAELLTGARGKEPSKKALTSVFAVSKLRSSDLETLRSEKENVPFQEELGRSFLPAIIQMAKDAKIKLTFLRVRTRTDAAAKKPRRLRSYDRALLAYLRKNGAEHVDLTGNAWETESLYGEGDHIHRRYRDQYTRLFVQHYRDVFD